VMELPPMGEWRLLNRKPGAHHVPDAVILVARSGCVGSWAVRRAVRRLKDADAILLGSMLT
jgi:Mrp family chromosome partitioning ATPase